ncbi:NINE protein [Clostridium gasigenes]|uniref:TM2 domain-containing protein n=1 Tax=Clostridium gasigenes TaxID=94869 RepID=UPI001C0D4A19|nr:TM2 domain-containing protein [Clostridium gasigenes]MBU3135418.1 NINE protein [Clostridium gasigenes]
MYCKECGESIVNGKAVICVKCGTKKGQGKNYCQECGTSVPSANADVCLACGVKLKNIMDSFIGGSQKSKLVAALFAFFLGTLGIHRFYLGYTTIGIVQIVLLFTGFITCGITSGIVAVWALVDFILILTGNLADISGAPLE